MLVEDQDDVIALLENPATHDGHSVERLQTHSAIVFLAGRRALKLKRAVRYDYLDFSTLEKRREACEAELRLNRRTAPSLYLGLLPIVRRPDGTLGLGGQGRPVDWVIEMVRFDQEALLDRLADRAALSIELMRDLAHAIADAHGGADPCPQHGGVAGMAWVIEGNREGFATEGAGILDTEACDRLIAKSKALLDRVGGLLESRRGEGRVRWCHGDLHLRNLVLLDGRPTLFDAVEFNPRIACGDVLYDLAFLLMDLWRRDLHRHASAVFNEYLTAREELSGLAAMPLFLSCRAAVRAKTSATAARLHEGAEQLTRQLEAQARRYLTLAEEFLERKPPRLIALGGRSGTGKSTLAARLAPGCGGAPGAVVLRSDVIRKTLAGVPLDRPLDPAAYTPAATALVYGSLVEMASTVVRTGYSVIADAVFLDPAHRAAIERAAAAAAVPFSGCWLDAPGDVLARRIANRRDDASDATIAVLARQLDRDPGPVGWVPVDATGDVEDVVGRIARALGLPGTPA